MNGSLETLSLAHNALHNMGAIELSEALIVNCTLRSLDVRFNSIGVEGTYAIGERTNPSPSARVVHTVCALEEPFRGRRTARQAKICDTTHSHSWLLLT